MNVIRSLASVSDYLFPFVSVVTQVSATRTAPFLPTWLVCMLLYVRAIPCCGGSRQRYQGKETGLPA
jgi:hypothetical protein